MFTLHVILDSSHSSVQKNSYVKQDYEIFLRDHPRQTKVLTTANAHVDKGRRMLDIAFGSQDQNYLQYQKTMNKNESSIMKFELK